MDQNPFQTNFQRTWENEKFERWKSWIQNTFKPRIYFFASDGLQFVINFLQVPNKNSNKTMNTPLPPSEFIISWVHINLSYFSKTKSYFFKFWVTLLLLPGILSLHNSHNYLFFYADAYPKPLMRSRPRISVLEICP